MFILVVEDEKAIASLVARSLEAAGHSVEQRHDGKEALSLALQKSFDLILLDVNLPSLDGFSLLRDLRKGGVDSRVIILTARSEVDERVGALNAGADDYLTKPFAMAELIARVGALGRRRGGQESASILEFADLRMDMVRRKLTRSGQLIDVTAREFDILRVLMQEPGHTVTRDEMCERIWDRQHTCDTNSVEVFIFRLRRKLDGGRPRSIIETVRHTGYALRPPD